MELRHLRYFVAVAEECSFRKASVMLRVAQPAISVQVRQLEDEIGTKLFDRVGRGVVLTAAGDVFLSYARQALREARSGIERARQAALGEIGFLNIGYNTAAGFLVFPTVIPAFHREHPGVKLHFHNLLLLPQLEALRSGVIDIGFAYLPVEAEGLDIAPLTDESLVAILPATHRLAREPSISIKDLSGEPLILPDSKFMPQMRRRIAHLFESHDSVINVEYEVEHAINLINLVATGLGCSLMPAYVLQIKQDAVVYKRIDSAELNFELAAVKLTSSRAPANLLFDIALRELKGRSA